MVPEVQFSPEEARSGLKQDVEEILKVYQMWGAADDETLVAALTEVRDDLQAETDY